jgi:hypothetical protein
MTGVRREKAAEDRTVVCREQRRDHRTAADMLMLRLRIGATWFVGWRKPVAE